MKEVLSSYTVSIHYDRRLYRQDIAGSIAHARMLAKQEIIANDEAEAIVRGLEDIRPEVWIEKNALVGVIEPICRGRP